MRHSDMKTVVAAVSAAKTCSRPAQSTQRLLAMASGGRILSELALTAAFNSTYNKRLTMHEARALLWRLCQPQRSVVAGVSPTSLYSVTERGSNGALRIPGTWTKSLRSQQFATPIISGL
jgi:hypothetical protein